MSKILIVHPDSSQLSTVIDTVNLINSKSGPFNAVIFLGDVLNSATDISTLSKLNISGYFCEGLSVLQQELITSKLQEKNITFLPNKAGIFTTVDNIKIAYLTGEEDYIKANHSTILEKLGKESKVDILITNKWSSVIANEQRLFYGDSSIDPVVELLKPKYHFCVGSNTQGKFFEHAPFKWEDNDVSRFISLGKFGNPNKEKWIYAFNLNQNGDSVGAIPADLSSNPYFMAKEKKASAKRSTKEEQDDNESQVIKKQKKEVSPKDCFFCLSNPQVQTHMIISIGEHAYMTIAKGPLTKPNSQISFSGHCLIIPIEHSPSLPSITVDGQLSVIKTPLYNEILRYQLSLVKLFTSLNHGLVFYQINKKDNFHFHLQCFPTPIDFLADFNQILKRNTDINNKGGKFKSNSKFKFIKFQNDTDEEYLKIINNPESEYIKFTTFIKSSSSLQTAQEIHISLLEPGKSLDLQFGRKVMAYLMRTPKRIKWMDCQQSEQREIEETESFKDAFRDFDFTLDQE